MKLLDFKSTKKVSGVYCIENAINGKMYIGSSKNLYSRSGWHRNSLQNNKHHNQHLQNAWNKYGEESFCIFVIELVHLDLLRKRESYYIQQYNTLDRQFGYNIEEVNETYRTVSEETKRKISDKMKGKKPEKALLKIQEMLSVDNSPFKNRTYSKETVLKIQETKSNWTEERRKEISLKLSRESKKRGTNYQEKETALLDINFNIIKTYKSAIEICKEYPIFSHSQITKICRGIQKKKIYKGYSFKYTEKKT